MGSTAIYGCENSIKKLSAVLGIYQGLGKWLSIYVLPGDFVIDPFSISISVYMQQTELHSFFKKLTSVVIISFILHSSLLRPLVFVWYLTKLECSYALKSFLLLSASIFLSEFLSPPSTCSGSMPKGFNSWCKCLLFHSLASKCLAYNIPS